MTSVNEVKNNLYLTKYMYAQQMLFRMLNKPRNDLYIWDFPMFIFNITYVQFHGI